MASPVQIPSRKLCCDLVNKALQEASVSGDLAFLPTRKRFQIFAKLMHAHVFPCITLEESASDFPIWNVSTYSFSLRGWRWGGRRSFISEATKMAWAEFGEINYDIFDLSPIRCLLGEDGARFRTVLHHQDMLNYRTRLAGMTADLALLESKLDKLQSIGKDTVITYRIAFHEHAVEARIHSRNSLFNLL